jgi:hypothetical protein
MGNIFPTGAKIIPSFTEPELIITYAQASGAFNALQGGKPRVKLGSEDMAVYVNTLDLRTEVVAGQSPSNLLPSASLAVDYYQTPTYLYRVRAIWDHHDMARASVWNVSLPSAQDLAMRQGIFQQMRNALLYGFQPANGEGLLNTTGATKVTLPPDSYGNTTVSTYDNGQMAIYFLGQVVTLKTRMYQSGGNIKNNIVAISPQRDFLQFQEQNIVQVTSYQRPGAGTETTGGVIKGVLAESGDTFTWHFDDTLIGQGTNGYDAVLLTMPEIEQPKMPGINTNIFATLQPNIMATNLMYVDMSAPMKIPTPTPDGAITEIQELRGTSGWNIRPQAITIISMPYS